MAGAVNLSVGGAGIQTLRLTMAGDLLNRLQIESSRVGQNRENKLHTLDNFPGEIPYLNLAWFLSAPPSPEAGAEGSQQIRQKPANALEV